MTSPANLRARILSVGNELTMGQTVDTNSAYLAQQLAGVGIETIGHETVGDNQPAIVQALRRAAELADVVIVSGGLGPTPDDVTRQALAEAMGAPLELDEASLANIEAYFRKRSRTMTPSNRVQAMVPKGAEPLPNTRGTAPGIAAKLGEAQVFVLPGVPYEMRAMFEFAVAPRLPAGRGVILHRIVRLFGTGESNFAEMLRDLLTDAGPLVVGTTVAAGLVSIRVHSRAETHEQAERQAQKRIEQILQCVGERALGVGEEATMESAVGALLRKTGKTLATAESCTGGLVGQMMTAVPGASEYYLGGVVSYADRVKEEQLGVPGDVLRQHGAVSEPVAKAMAIGVRERLGADYGIAITGIAGPAGGTDEKPVGLVYTALAGPNGTAVEKHLLSGDRPMIRLRAALAALNPLRLQLLKQ
ncbi:MAG: competence/damage-inducible protein A [Phycisphaerae bacterium]|nr:competence/damage-inducible protein A [Phycisphaerae bacterium]